MPFLIHCWPVIVKAKAAAVAVVRTIRPRPRVIRKFAAAKAGGAAATATKTAAVTKWACVATPIGALGLGGYAAAPYLSGPGGVGVGAGEVFAPGFTGSDIGGGDFLDRGIDTFSPDTLIVPITADTVIPIPPGIVIPIPLDTSFVPEVPVTDLLPPVIPPIWFVPDTTAPLPPIAPIVTMPEIGTPTITTPPEVVPVPEMSSVAMLAAAAVLFFGIRLLLFGIRRLMAAQQGKD